MSEAYQETREIPNHHIIQGNDLIIIRGYVDIGDKRW